MKRNLFLLLLLVLQAPLWTGCTAMLWNKSTFATYFHPADPANLQLYYSNARKDLLVQYDESRKPLIRVAADVGGGIPRTLRSAPPANERRSKRHRAAALQNLAEGVARDPSRQRLGVPQPYAAFFACAHTRCSVL